jgi:hypothetical protein
MVDYLDSVSLKDLVEKQKQKIEPQPVLMMQRTQHIV